MNEGKLIVIEGIDGSGKTTLIEGLKEKFLEDGYDVSNHETYGTIFGKTIRNMCNQNFMQLTNTTIALLMYATFVEFCDKIIKPALDQNKIILVDRWFSSTLVYQSIGLEKPEVIYNIHLAVHPELCKVDKFIYLDVSVNTAMERLNGKKKDHFEKKGVEFFETALEWYRVSTQLNENNCFSYNAEISADELLEQVYNDLSEVS